jgi:NAD kinase
MNEVTLHRGRYPHLTSLDCYIDKQYLTECVVSLFFFKKKENSMSMCDLDSNIIINRRMGKELDIKDRNTYIHLVCK